MNNSNGGEGQQLVTAIKETLERTGTLDNVRAQLRATILKCMDNSLTNSDSCKSAPPIENLLINELIAEYLSFNGYEHTLSVFNIESRRNCGKGEDHLDESFIRAELGLPNRSSSKSLAMLYEVVFMMKSRLRNIR